MYLYLLYNYDLLSLTFALYIKPFALFLSSQNISYKTVILKSCSFLGLNQNKADIEKIIYWDLTTYFL